MNKILYNNNGYIVGVTEDGKYFECYKNLNLVNILGAAGMYIQELQNEIKNLKNEQKH